MANHHVLQEFENALKDVVSTKRASVSKMTRLNEAAKKCFEVCFASSTGYSKTKPISAHLLLSCPLNRLLTFWLTERRADGIHVIPYTHVSATSEQGA